MYTTTTTALNLIKSTIIGKYSQSRFNYCLQEIAKIVCIKNEIILYQLSESRKKQTYEKTLILNNERHTTRNILNKVQTSPINLLSNSNKNRFDHKKTPSKIPRNNRVSKVRHSLLSTRSGLASSTVTPEGHGGDLPLLLVIRPLPNKRVGLDRCQGEWFSRYRGIRRLCIELPSTSLKYMPRILFVIASLSKTEVTLHMFFKPSQDCHSFVPVLSQNYILREHYCSIAYCNTLSKISRHRSRFPIIPAYFKEPSALHGRTHKVLYWSSQVTAIPVSMGVRKKTSMYFDHFHVQCFHDDVCVLLFKAPVLYID